MSERKLDSLGREIISDERVEIPARLRRPDTIAEQIQRTVKQELSLAASQVGFESFDEADDFDVGDEDPRSIHELDDDQLEYDIRHDPRYQRRPDEPPQSTSEGTPEGERPVRGGGKKEGKDSKGDKRDKSDVGEDTDGEQ